LDYFENNITSQKVNEREDAGEIRRRGGFADFEYFVSRGGFSKYHGYRLAGCGF